MAIFMTAALQNSKWSISICLNLVLILKSWAARLQGVVLMDLRSGGLCSGVKAKIFAAQLDL